MARFIVEEIHKELDGLCGIRLVLMAGLKVAREKFKVKAIRDIPDDKVEEFEMEVKKQVVSWAIKTHTGQHLYLRDL